MLSTNKSFQTTINNLITHFFLKSLVNVKVSFRSVRQERIWRFRPPLPPVASLAFGSGIAIYDISLRSLSLPSFKTSYDEISTYQIFTLKKFLRYDWVIKSSCHEKHMYTPWKIKWDHERHFCVCYINWF